MAGTGYYTSAYQSYNRFWLAAKAHTDSINNITTHSPYFKNIFL